MLCVYLFGVPRIEANGQALPLRRSKALALLAYLAVTRHPQDRDTLLGLLWPEFDTDSARNNLRRELSLLKTTIGDGALMVERSRVSWNTAADVWLDVADFEQHLATARHDDVVEASANTIANLTKSVRLYRDDFLAGFNLPDSPAFEEWQFFQREELRQQFALVLQALMNWHSQRGAYDEALVYARRQLAVDPLHEPARRDLMRLYAWTGQQAAAIRQYEEGVRLLEQELGVPPEAETTELYQAIKSRRLQRLASTPPADARAATEPTGAAPLPTPALPARHNNLPAASPDFVGREVELADIIRRLTDLDCRLLTLVGPGGIGKTQLALRAAQVLAEGWADDEALADGVLFVPLVGLQSSSEIVSTLASAAHFDFYPTIPPQQQLFDYLRNKRLLLLLDNCEHLQDAAAFVSELLAAAPGLRLLVTSREALSLQEEWFHPIEGLSTPDPGIEDLTMAQLAHFDAIRLFEQQARRVQRNFQLSREREQVVQLCWLLAGTPLAIELAASWLKLLSVAQIVQAVQHNLDILTARTRNIPLRHQSMRVVLEESWRLLTAGEQAVLAGLSVFCGGFGVAAATAVCGANLPVLAALVERSLLRSVDAGRFQLHELLRQFASEQLAADAQDNQQVHARHCVYYLDVLAGQEQDMIGHEQPAAITTIAREAENVRAAWQWACEQSEFEHLDASLDAYFAYLATRSTFQEGFDRFTQAVAASTAAPNNSDLAMRERVYARASIRAGVFAHYLGNAADSARLIEQGLQYARQQGLQHDIALARLIQGVAAGVSGNADQARLYLNEALAIGRAHGDRPIIANALHELALISSHYGDFAEGKRLAEESVAFSRASGQINRTAYALVQQAWLSACRGEYEEAEACWQEALELFEGIGNQYGTALALGGTGYVAWSIGGDRLAEARRRTERSLELLRKLNHRVSMTSRLSDLALIELDEGNYARAEIHAREGLSIARQVHSTVYTASHLSILGHIAATRQHFAEGRHFLREALHYAFASRLWPRLAFSCYYAALLLAQEAAFLADQKQAEQRRSSAITLLTAIADHRSTIYLYRQRAQLHSRQLQTSLPPDRVVAALAGGRELDLQASIEPLLAMLEPATVPPP